MFSYLNKVACLIHSKGKILWKIHPSTISVGVSSTTTNQCFNLSLGCGQWRNISRGERGSLFSSNTSSTHVGSAILCKSKCKIGFYWSHTFSKGPKDPFDEASLFCQPCDKAYGEGLFKCGEDGFGTNVCHSKIQVVPFTYAFYHHHHGGCLSSCLAAAHGCVS